MWHTRDLRLWSKLPLAASAKVICLAKSPPSSRTGVRYTKRNGKTFGNLLNDLSRWIGFKELTVIKVLRMWSEITSPICTGGFGRTASLRDACLASCTARLAPSRASQLLGANRGVIPDHILNARLTAPFMLEIDFSDHTQGVFDADAYLASHAGPRLDELRDPAYFQRFFVDAGALC